MFTYSKFRRFLGDFRKYGEILGLFRRILFFYDFLGFFLGGECGHPVKTFKLM